MTINGSRASALALIAAMMTATWAGDLGAQKPISDSASKALSVEIVVNDPGKKVPRVDAEGEPVPGAFTLQGRSLVWIVGKDRYSTPEEVRRAMLRHLQVAENAVQNQETGGVMAPPLRLVASPGVVWDDVVRVVEWSYGEGFVDVLLPGAWRHVPEFVPLGVTEPVSDHGVTVVPACLFNEPDDGPPERWRPSVDVRQDGVVTSDGELVFEPGKDRDLARLRKAVGAWAPKARLQDGLVPPEVSGSDLAISRTYVVIRADKWVEWFRVQAVMQECAKGELVFCRFYFAVADEEREVAPKPAAPEEPENK